MNFHLAETFTAALARLSAQDAKQVKATVVDLAVSPAAPGHQLHRIERSKDPNFWSARVGRDLRLIVHRTAASLLVAYVGHHNDAYAWAERRRIEAHPKTGAIQIVEVRERVEEVAPVTVSTVAPPKPPLFAGLDREAMLGVGVPEDWLADVAVADEDRFLALAEHLPTEAAEALLTYAATGALPPPPVPADDPYAHPDAQRRIRAVASETELAQALEFPWERWSVFLHPTQRAVVERSFGGPARVAGSAGTGKTVVALHRAVRLARARPDARVLIATFSEPLARALEGKARVLGATGSRLTVASWSAVATELFQLAFGHRPRLASAALVRQRLAEAAEATSVTGFPMRFLEAEWTQVVDAWGIDGPDAYSRVPRLGRRSPLGPRQRERLWTVFEHVSRSLASNGLLTEPGLFRAIAAHHRARDIQPFDHVVVDEAQDLGPAELAFLAAVVPPGPDTLFFAGDLGQRIFQAPFSWASLGIDVRGRSSTLTVCYRTSHQIRAAADGLLPPALRDVDGNEERRAGTVSTFDGPAPVIELAASEADEIALVARHIAGLVAEGVRPEEAVVIVREPAALARAASAVAASGVAEVATVIMHLAKGLEYRAVIVMACDQDLLPLESRIAEAAGEGQLDDVYETERQLLYVACTRARDRLLLTGVAPGSEFMKDFTLV